MRVEGEAPKIYEDLDGILETLCKKLNNGVDEYSVSEVTNMSPLGKIVLGVGANLLLHLSDYKISDDRVIDNIAKTVLATSIGLTIGHIVDSVIEVEMEKFNIKSPCQPRKENPLTSVITEWK